MHDFDPSSRLVRRSARLTFVLGADAIERDAYAEQLARSTGAPIAPTIAGHESAASDVADLAEAVTQSDEMTAAIVAVPGDVDLTHALGAAAAAEVDSAVVTIVDATRIMRQLGSQAYLDREEPHGPVVVAQAAITVQHLELADLLVVVGHERLPAHRLTRLSALLAHLNPTARIALRGTTVVEPPIGRGRTAFGERPGWVRALNGEHDPVFTDVEVRTFRYEHTRPFHTPRLMRLLEGDLAAHRFGALIRSAGFCRFATRPGRAALWDQVGSMITFEPLASDVAAPDLATTGQELVLTGIRMDIAALTTALDACALSDRELLEGPRAWSRIPDPLPRWVEH